MGLGFVEITSVEMCVYEFLRGQVPFESGEFPDGWVEKTIKNEFERVKESLKLTHGREFSWDEAYQNYVEYIASPIQQAIRRTKFYKHYPRLGRNEVYMMYIRMRNILSLIHSKDPFDTEGFFQYPSEVFYHILKMKYGSEQEDHPSLIGFVRYWWYVYKTRKLFNRG